ncbi:hypothetical protein A3K78_05065 [Candidatus Bathyarchaeota archaeon RBG_13_52_12]|nr:MAG: hypothetical protein A3K78_05065 [Candidatus Bathyarchaeota archaeon RBG_13_52_12]
MRTLLLDANSIMLVVRAGRSFEGGGDTRFATVGIAVYELGNAVWKDIHLFKRVTRDEAHVLLTVFHEMLLRLRVEPQLSLGERLEVLENAGRHGISYYDSSYLTAAIRLGATLVTEDRGLTRVAEACGVPTSSASGILVG